MKKNKKILGIIILTAIMILGCIGLTTAASSYLDSLKLKNSNSKVDTDGELAQYITENPEEFLKSDDVFDIVGQPIEADQGGASKPATNSNAGACLAHNYNTNKGSTYKITDVIDFRSSGIKFQNSNTAEKIKTAKATKESDALSYLLYQRFNCTANSNSLRAKYRYAIEMYFYRSLKNNDSFGTFISKEFKNTYIDVLTPNIVSDQLMNEKENGISPNSLISSAKAYAEAVAKFKDIQIDKSLKAKVEESGNYKYVGPIKVTYTKDSSVSNLKGVDIDITAKNANGSNINYSGVAKSVGGQVIKQINTANGSNIKSNEEFYLVFDKNININTLNFTVSTSMEEYHSKMILLLNKQGRGQTLAIFGAEKATRTSNNSYTYEFGKDITIVKRDADNANTFLNAGFIVYYKEGNTDKYVKINDGRIEYVSGIENAQIFYTDSITGKRTISGLRADVDFHIEEVDAPENYRLDMQKKDSQGRIIKTVSKGSDAATIEFTNKKYGDLLLLKVDEETDEPIEGIGFYIKDPNGKYITGYSEEDLTLITSDEKPSVPPVITTTNSEGIILLKNIPIGTYLYQEDYESMISRGYINSYSSDIETVNGTTQFKWKEKVVVGRGEEVNVLTYLNTFTNIFNSDLIREKIAKEEWTDVELSQKLYNSIISILGEEEKADLRFDVSKQSDLLLSEISSTITNIETLSGKERYETAINVANESFSNAEVENVILVSSLKDGANNVSDYINALTLSNCLNAPILIVDNSTLYKNNELSSTGKKLDEYSNLKKVYIIGGDGAISEQVESDINQITGKTLSYDRVKGSDRYATSIEVAEKVYNNSGDNSSIIIVPGNDGNIDSALIASVSAAKKIPVVYIDLNEFTIKENNGVYEYTLNESENSRINTLKGYLKTKTSLKNIYMIGSIANEDFGKVLEISNSKAKMVVGENRFDTNIEIVNEFYKDKNDIKNIVFAKNTTSTLDLVISSNIAIDGETVIILLPNSTLYENSAEYSQDEDVIKIKEYLLNSGILNSVLSKNGKIYTVFSNDDILKNEIESWIKTAKYKDYAGVKLGTLIHENCLYTKNGNKLNIYMKCTHSDSCNCEKYCYYNSSIENSYLKDVIQILKFDAKYESVREALAKHLSRSSMTEEQYKNKIYKYLEIIYKEIFGVIEFDEDFKTSYITYYANQILGYSSRRILNKNNSGKLEIVKVDALDNKIPLKAGFKIYKLDENNNKQYLIIHNKKGQSIASTGDAIPVDTSEYDIQYTTKIEEATEVFTNPKDGKLSLTRLRLGTYYVIETTKPSNAYELNLQDINNEPKEITITRDEPKEPIVIENIPSVKFIVKKVNSNNESTVLSNVWFKIKKTGTEEYIVIKNKENNSVTGTVTIENLNDINYKGTEAEATTFVTDNNGLITINNLFAGEYTLVEIENNNPAFAANNLEFDVKLDADSDRKEIITKTETISNTPEYAKLSGRVWIDKNNGKNNSQDALYNSGVDQNASGIKVDLMHKDQGTIATTTIGNNGQYQFNGTDSNGNYLIKISEIDKYYVQFTYNGIEYTSVVLNKDVVNGSKAKEVATSRDSLNNNFEKVDYDKTIKVAENKISTNVIATTQAAEYVFSKDNIVDDTIINVNLGLVSREKSDIELTEDLENAIVVVNGYQHTYDYVSYKENEKASSVTAKFKNKELGVYTRELYPSDIVVASQDNSKLAVYSTYKITLTNNSTTLKTKVNQLITHYDANYTIVDVIGATFEDKGNDNNNPGYKYGYINLDGEIAPNGGQKVIEIKYQVNTSTVVTELLKGNDVLLNTKSEINSYTTLYGENSYEGSDFEVGDICVGLDKDSTPGNGIIKPVTVKNGVQSGEDDGDIATTFKLQLSDHTREIKGTVWKDEKLNGKIIGNGQLDNGEKKVSGVKVELIDKDGNKVNKYTITDQIDSTTGQFVTNKDGIAEATSNDDGTYSISGIIPGNYKLRYTYSDGTTRIVGLDGFSVRNYKSTILNGNAESTKAFTDNNINWAYGDQDKNYNDAVDNLAQRDNIDTNTRITNKTLKEEQLSMYADTPTFAVGVELTNVSNNATQSPAYYKDKDGNFQLIDYSTVSNIDFGIIERPKQNAEISKEITNIKLTLGNGQVLIEGDPSKKDASITYVKTGLDGTVPMEIDFELLPATVEVEYTITVKDTSEQDYAYKNQYGYDGTFYYYGITEGVQPQGGIKINKVVDYLPSELIYDEEKNKDNWDVVTAQELADQGLISTEDSNNVKEELDSKYTIIVSKENTFGQLNVGETKSVKLYSSAVITSTVNDLRFANYAEILDYTSRNIIQKDNNAPSTPGNYNPSDSSTKEADSDSVEFVITPPTGENKDYTVYYIVGASVLIILGLGIVIIKKKVINK